ncbi:MAG: hypothetical protein ACLQU1_15435 [Bryobacteraceae bacterium]
MAFCTTCGATVTGAFCNQCGTRVNAAAPSSAGASAGPAQPAAAPPAQPAAGPLAQPAAPPYGAQPAPRKTSPLVWVLVVILGLFVLFGIGIAGLGFFVAHKVHQAGIDPDLWRRNPGLAVGKLLAATNPNLDVVRTDDNAGTITLRDRRTGKETTITFDQARQGKFSIRTEDDNGKTASVEFGGSGSKPPAWVPDYPGSHPTYSIKGSADSGEEGGNFTFTTDDPASKVMAFYQDKTREMGMEAKVATTTPDGGMLVAAREDDDRSLTIVVGGNSGQTTVNVTYARKR